jgi:F0F1-type ATP synthase membrane subunit c/vacuolar-type H+-ATPase subunit K
MEPGKQPSLWPLAIIGLLFALFSSKRNQPSQSIHPQDTTEGKHEHIPAKDTLSHTNAIKPNSTKNESQNRDWVKISAIAQACAVPLGLGLLIVSICQSRATQTASDTAARQVADFEDTQRAILQVHPVWDNTTQRIVYNVRNIGQTIATEIDAENNGGATGPLKQPVPSFPPIDKMRASKQSIPPSKYGFSLRAGECTPIPESSPIPIEEVTSGKAYYLDVFNVGFRDIFGKEGHAYACVWYNGTGHEGIPSGLSHCFGDDAAGGSINRLPEQPEPPCHGNQN